MNSTRNNHISWSLHQTKRHLGRSAEDIGNPEDGKAKITHSTVTIHGRGQPAQQVQPQHSRGIETPTWTPQHDKILAVGFILGWNGVRETHSDGTVQSTGQHKDLCQCFSLWPGSSTDTAQFVKSRPICASIHPTQRPTDVLNSRAIQGRTLHQMYSVSIGAPSYQLIVNYFSSFIEIQTLSSRSVTQHCKPSSHQSKRLHLRFVQVLIP